MGEGVVNELPDETGGNVGFLAVLVADADGYRVDVGGGFDGADGGVAIQAVQNAGACFAEIVAIELGAGPRACAMVQVRQPFLADEMEMARIAPVARDTSDCAVLESARDLGLENSAARFTHGVSHT